MLSKRSLFFFFFFHHCENTFVINYKNETIVFTEKKNPSFYVLFKYRIYKRNKTKFYAFTIVGWNVIANDIVPTNLVIENGKKKREEKKSTFPLQYIYIYNTHWCSYPLNS